MARLRGVRRVAPLPFLMLILFAFLSSGSQAAEPLKKVRAAVRTGAHYAPFYLGKEKGFFEAEGIEIEPVVVRVPVAIAAIINGDIEFMVPLGSALRATRKGFPLKVLLVVQSKAPWSLFVRPEIRTLGDLPGKLLGVDEPESSKTVATKMALQKKGFDPGKVKFRFIAGDPAQYAALKADQLDGAVLTPPFSNMARKDGYRELLWLGEVVDLPLNGLVGTEGMIRKNPELVRRVVRATQRSLKYVMDHPGETTAWVIRAYRQERSLAEGAVENVLRTFNPLGMLPIENLFAETVFLTPTAKLPPLEQVADFSFVERTEALRSK